MGQKEQQEKRQEFKKKDRKKEGVTEQKQVYGGFDQETLRVPQILCVKLMELKLNSCTLYNIFYVPSVGMANHFFFYSILKRCS